MFKKIRDERQENFDIYEKKLFFMVYFINIYPSLLYIIILKKFFKIKLLLKVKNVTYLWYFSRLIYFIRFHNPGILDQPEFYSSSMRK